MYSSGRISASAHKLVADLYIIYIGFSHSGTLGLGVPYICDRVLSWTVIALDVSVSAFSYQLPKTGMGVLQP